MNEAILILASTAAAIGFVHTLSGPDHYLPFIAMSKARNWSLPKTLWITFLCGVGHVTGPIILGNAGAALGIALGKIELFDAWRGNLAAQALAIFGFTYFIWGLHRAYRNHPHKHPHPSNSITPWVLFTIFILGPCEPLIPLIMYPASEHNTAGMLMVAGVFSLVTIITMLGVVWISTKGLQLFKFSSMERFSHALAGAAVCVSGLAILLLGL